MLYSPGERQGGVLEEGSKGSDRPHIWQSRSSLTEGEDLRVNPSQGGRDPSGISTLNPETEMLRSIPQRYRRQRDTGYLRSGWLAGSLVHARCHWETVLLLQGARRCIHWDFHSAVPHTIKSRWYCLGDPAPCPITQRTQDSNWCWIIWTTLKPNLRKR